MHLLKHMVGGQQKVANILQNSFLWKSKENQYLKKDEKNDLEAQIFIRNKCALFLFHICVIRKYFQSFFYIYQIVFLYNLS